MITPMLHAKASAKPLRVLGLIMLSLGSLLLSGCGLILNTQFASHTETYNLFFEDLRMVYAYHDQIPSANGGSINGLRDMFAASVYDGMSDCEFASVLNDVEHQLDDPHVYFEFPTDVYLYGCVTEQFDFQEDFYKNNITWLATSTYLTNTSTQDIFPSGIIELQALRDAGIYTGSLTHVIGYILIDALVVGFEGSSRLAGARAYFIRIEDTLKRFNAAGMTGLIVDIRTAAGGSQDNARFLAARFIDQARPYLIENERTGIRTFVTNTLTIVPEGTHHYRTGPLILITDHDTCSGAEMFSLAMRQRAQLIHIGRDTLGCAGGILARDLANGWLVTVTSSRTSYPGNVNGDGEVQYLREGIPPDEEISIANLLVQPQEPVVMPFIERALELLSDENEFNTIYNTLARHQ